MGGAQILPRSDDFEAGATLYGKSPALYLPAVVIDDAIPSGPDDWIHDVRRLTAGAASSLAGPNKLFAAAGAPLSNGGRGGACWIYRKLEDQFGEVTIQPNRAVVSGTPNNLRFYLSVMGRVQGGTLTNVGGGTEDTEWYHDLPSAWIFAQLYNGSGGLNRLVLLECLGGAANTIVRGQVVLTDGYPGDEVRLPPPVWRRPRRIGMRFSDAGGGSTLIECMIEHPLSESNDIVVISHTTSVLPGAGRWGFSISAGSTDGGVTGAPYLSEFSITEPAGSVVVKDKWERQYAGLAALTVLPSGSGQWAEGLSAADLKGRNPACGWNFDEGSSAVVDSALAMQVLEDPASSTRMEIGGIAGETPSFFVPSLVPQVSANQHYRAKIQLANDAGVDRHGGIILRALLGTAPGTIGAFGQPRSGYAFALEYISGVISAAVYDIGNTAFSSWNKIADVNIAGIGLILASAPTCEFEVLNATTGGGLTGVALQVKVSGDIRILTPTDSGVITLESGTWLFDLRSTAPQDMGLAGFFLVSDGPVSVTTQGHMYAQEWIELASSDLFGGGGEPGDPSTIILPSEIDGASGTLTTPIDWPVRMVNHQPVYEHPLETGHVSRVSAQISPRRRWSVEARGRDHAEYLALLAFFEARASEVPFTWQRVGGTRASVGAVESVIVRFINGRTLAPTRDWANGAGVQVWRYAFEIEELLSHEVDDVPGGGGEDVNTDYGMILGPTGTEADFGTVGAGTGPNWDFGGI